MGSLSGELILSFTYLLPFSRGVYSQGNNILFLAMSVRETKRKSRKLFPLAKMTENMDVYPTI